jgi:secondary thiamine-phosphate synthase enzyme
MRNESMKVFSSEIHLSTEGWTDTRDITPQVRGEVKASKIQEGLVTVFVPGSTASVTTMEFEPNLVKDLKETAERWAPSSKRYHHDATWGDDNGFAHMRHTLMGPSLTVPLHKGELTLGTWQQIVLVDFDNRPRDRSVVVHILGE